MRLFPHKCKEKSLLSFIGALPASAVADTP